MSLTHFESLFVYYVRQLVYFFFFFQLNSQHHLLKTTFLSSCLCHMSTGHKRKGLFLKAQICFIDLCLSLCQYQILLMTRAYIASRNESSPILFFFKKFWLLCLFYFHVHFRYSLSISAKMPTGLLMEIELNLWISLGRTVIVAILSLPIDKHKMSLHLFYLDHI